MGLKNRTCITDFDVDMILPLIYKKKVLYAGIIQLMLCFDVKHLIKKFNVFVTFNIWTGGNSG